MRTKQNQRGGLCFFMSAWLCRANLLFFSLLFLVHLHSAQAQILVAGTSFDPSPGNEGRTYIGLNDIVQTGVQTGDLSSTPPIAPNVDPDVFNANYYYAITDNPYKLDNTRYANLATPDYQFVYGPRPSGGNINILQYSVRGMLPGSAVTVRVSYCSAVSSAYAPCTGQRNEFKAGINLDQFNQLNGTDATQIGMGECATKDYTGTVATNGDMIFRMNHTRDGACMAMGIKSIEVFGFIKPIAYAAEGTEVCAGEQVTLQTTINYNASYQWQVSTNGGTSWSNIAGGTNKSALYEMATTGTYMFRVGITPTSSTTEYSDPITVNAITCCTIGGLPAGRQTIYYDNFGRIDLTNTAGTTYYEWDYTDPLNPVEVQKTTATPFRWQISPAPLGATFRATGPPNDGEYTVAAYLTGYNAHNGYQGAKLEWANRVTGPTTPIDPSYDHSGQLDGAALFINCPPNTEGDVLYERTITNLCFGKQLFFECWIAVFTNSASGAYNPVDVLVRLTDSQNPGSPVTASAIATRQADGGGVWVRVGAQITLSAANSTLHMELINNQNVSVNGNDLVLDDIKIMACAPPPIDVFFDIPTLSTQEAFCTGSLDLFSQPSNLLKSFYSNSQLYLFQWTRTPEDYTSWQNIGSPQSGDSYTIANILTHPSFAGLTDGGKVYFRIIAAHPSTYTAKNNFQGAGNYANINDPCKNYSVSEPIEAIYSCPLPVELISFTGHKVNESNKLIWLTSSETDNDYFLIERSGNGTDFTVIGKVEGNGTVNGLNTYHFYDDEPLPGVNYYRLKQVDLDGKFQNSQVISIHGEESEIYLFPNPAHHSFSVMGHDPVQEYQIEIKDLQGKTVFQSKGDQLPTEFTVSDLADGIYMVTLYINDKTMIKKLIIY